MMKPYLRDREREAKVSTVTGIVLTVAVHVLACLLCVFTGMKYIYPPPQEQTFLVDFSEDEPQPIRRQNRGRQPQAEEIDRTKPVELIQRSESPHRSGEARTRPPRLSRTILVMSRLLCRKEEINKNALFPGMSKKDSSNAPHSATEPKNEFKAGHPKGNTSSGKAEAHT